MINNATIIQQQQKHQRRHLIALVLLCVLVLMAFVLSMSLGSVDIPLDEIVAILLGQTPERASWTTIVLKFRLPKALTAVLAGAALATAGLQMQTLFRNPLAGPFVLGINSGATLGVALAILATGTSATALLPALGFFGQFGIVAAASIGAGVVMFIVIIVSRRVGVTTLLIVGLLLGYATSAIVSLLVYFAITSDRLTAFIAWSFGSFGGVTWGQLQVLIPVITIALLAAWLSAKPLNALLLGESGARTLGVSVRRARFIIMVSAAVLAGSITAFCGPIAFVGVAVPHLARSLFDSADHRLLIPSTILIGAFVALMADLIAQLPGTQSVLPLNAVTALIGAPIVAWVILRRRNLQAAFG